MFDHSLWRNSKMCETDKDFLTEGCSLVNCVFVKIRFDKVLDSLHSPFDIVAKWFLCEISNLKF